MKPITFVRSKIRPAARSAFETYFTLDPRSLGVGRIGLGVLLFYDLVRRIPGLSTWYANGGLLPNHIALRRPAAEYMFSFLFAASRPEEAACMFALSAFVFVLFTVGYRTKLFHALSLACTVSLHSRAIFLENGGDVVLNLLCAWTLFLPMGARFSVDALRESLARRREQTIGDLNDRASLPPKAGPVASLAVLAILVQLSLIYYLNALHKTGWTWRQGMAVHYVFFQERMVTWLGVLARPYLFPELTRRMTYTTWNLELLAAPLILNPFFKVWSRRAMMIVLPGLHLGFAAVLNLGQFSFNMIGFYPLFLGERDWALAERWFAPAPSRARTVHVRRSSLLAWTWARLLTRLDAFERLQFAPLDDETRDAWAVENPTTGARTTGTAALAECLAALPCGLPLAELLRFPPVRTFGDAMGRALSSERATEATAFEREGTFTAAARHPSPARRWSDRRVAELRELLIVIVAVALGSQVLVENKAIPARYKVHQAKWMQQVVSYPRLFQGWGMFSPDVPTGERMLYVDAITVTGRHVDPFNEAGSRTATLPVERIPEHMEQDEFWCDFTNRVPDNDTYWPALKAWVFDYPNRTERPENRIVSFEAKLLEQENPPPGERTPRNFKTKVMLRGFEGQP